MRGKFILCLVLACACGCAMNAGKSNTFYVSNNGNDSASGSLEQPFCSLPRALSAARDVRAKSALKEIAIQIRGGTYFLDAPIAIAANDSGVTIAAYKDETPILSGGVQIKGWKPAELNGHKCLAVDLPSSPNGQWSFRELWMNGRRAVRARFPNKGYLKIAEPTTKPVEWTNGAA